MWEIFHKVFGWHYIQFEYGYSTVQRRVRELNGKRYVKCYGEVFVLMPDGSLVGHHHKYTPLTWSFNTNKG
jgi:hypothetical protein